MINHVITLLMGLSREDVPSGFVYAPDRGYRPTALPSNLAAAREVWFPAYARTFPIGAMSGLMAAIVARIHIGWFDSVARADDPRITYDPIVAASAGLSPATVTVVDPSGTLSARVYGTPSKAALSTTVTIRGLAQSINLTYAGGGSRRADLSFSGGVSAPVPIGATGYSVVFSTPQEEYPSTAVTTVSVHGRGDADLAQRVEVALRAYTPGALAGYGYDDVDARLDRICTDGSVHVYREAALALLTARAIGRMS